MKIISLLGLLQKLENLSYTYGQRRAKADIVQNISNERYSLRQFVETEKEIHRVKTIIEKRYGGKK